MNAILVLAIIIVFLSIILLLTSDTVPYRLDKLFGKTPLFIVLTYNVTDRGYIEFSQYVSDVYLDITEIKSKFSEGGDTDGITYSNSKKYFYSTLEKIKSGDSRFNETEKMKIIEIVEEKIKSKERVLI